MARFMRHKEGESSRYVPDVIMPKFWYQQGKVSDMKGVMARMRVIPKEKQQEVANEYERLFLSENTHAGRKKANAYLNSLATEYLSKKNEIH